MRCRAGRSFGGLRVNHGPRFSLTAGAPEFSSIAPSIPLAGEAAGRSRSRARQPFDHRAAPVYGRQNLAVINLREPRGKAGARGAPFPLSNDPAAVLAVKAKPCGCAARSLDRSEAAAKRQPVMRERGLMQRAVHRSFVAAPDFTAPACRQRRYTQTQVGCCRFRANGFVFSTGLVGPDWLRFVKRDDDSGG